MPCWLCRNTVPTYEHTLRNGVLFQCALKELQLGFYEAERAPPCGDTRDDVKLHIRHINYKGLLTVYVNTVRISLAGQPRVPYTFVDNSVIDEETEGDFGLVGACHYGCCKGAISGVGRAGFKFSYFRVSL